MTHPKARQDDLVVQELFGELVVYDLARDQVHSLNPTAARVWQGCDGQTSPAQLADRWQPELQPAQAEKLVWLALDRLGKAHLLEEKVSCPGDLKISRRRVLQALGISALLLPVVASIPAPAAAQSWTCAGTIMNWDTTEFGGDCAAIPESNLNSFCRRPANCGSDNAYYIACDSLGDSEVKIYCCCPPATP